MSYAPSKAALETNRYIVASIVKLYAWAAGIGLLVLCNL